MAVTDRVRPVDWVVAAYNALLAGVWGALLGREPYAALICAAHAAAVAMPALLRCARGRLAPPVSTLRELYPLLWLLGFWTELGFLHDALHFATWDAAVAELDRAVFGRHLNAEWMPRAAHRWLSEGMHCAYVTYYPLIFLPPVAVLAAGRMAALRDMTFRLIVAYLGCYVVYLAFPVDGPAHTLAGYAGPLTQGWFYRLAHRLNRFGDSMGTAFPSSHVVGAVTIAYLGWRWFSRSLAALLTAEAGGVLLATVYTQNHFAVDSLAGLAWALVLQTLMAPALEGALGAGRKRPVPILPRYARPSFSGGAL